jgi:diguanylate cyclase (GGDEF)-like protein
VPKMDERRLASRVGGQMMLVGAALGLVSVMLPPRATGSDVIVLGAAAIAAALGIAMLRSRLALPEWVLGTAIATGTVLITLATYEGGTLNAGTDDNEMLYVWICLLAFNFLSFRHALAQLGLIAIAYGLLLTDTPLGEAATRWVISITTLLVAGVVIHSLRSSRQQLVSELSEQARTDGLTGLLNRTSLEERADLELARGRRDGTPLSLIVLDVDGFKDFNDSRGHPAGDELLRAVADGLRRETRHVDALARLGGDEFAVLLPGASLGDAELVAHRLCMIGSTLARPRATLSVGVAESSAEDEFETLWHAADGAMYDAKRAGGDSVRTTSSIAEEAARDLAGDPSLQNAPA